MLLYNFKRKLRRKRFDRLQKASGRIYHHHLWEIVVSENELLLQLQECSTQTNLLNLLIYGKTLPDYEIILMRVALKFEFIGSLVFPINEKETDKPPAKVYVRELFQGFYETIDEVKDHIQAITSNPVPDELAKKIFRKLAFVINTCCPLMSETFERQREGTYRTFIEYAIEHDDFDFPDENNIWKIYPKDIPKNECIRCFLLSKMPADFVEKELLNRYCYDAILW